jgi:hypothetical protein
MGNTCLPRRRHGGGHGSDSAGGEGLNDTVDDSSPLHDLQAVIRRFDCLYEYYRERLEAEQVKAARVGKRDRVRSRVHSALARRYEHAMITTAGFQTRLNEVLIDLQVVQNTADSMQVLNRYGNLLGEMLDKIHRETNVRKVLEKIEHDVVRLQGMNETIREGVGHYDDSLLEEKYIQLEEYEIGSEVQEEEKEEEEEEEEGKTKDLVSMSSRQTIAASSSGF